MIYKGHAMNYTIYYYRLLQLIILIGMVAITFFMHSHSANLSMVSILSFSILMAFALCWLIAFNFLIDAYRKRKKWAWITNLVFSILNIASPLMPFAVLNIVLNCREKLRTLFLADKKKKRVKFCPQCMTEIDYLISETKCNNCLYNLNSEEDKSFAKFLFVIGSGISATFFLCFLLVAGQNGNLNIYRNIAELKKFQFTDYSKLSNSKLFRMKMECHKENDQACLLNIDYEFARRNPKSNASKARYAFRLTHLGYHSQAIEVYENLRANMTFDTAAFYAESLQAIGKNKEAIKWYSYSLSLSDNSVDVAYGLSKLLIKEGNSKAALKVINKFIKKYPQAKDSFKPLNLVIESKQSIDAIN